MSDWITEQVKITAICYYPVETFTSNNRAFFESVTQNFPMEHRHNKFAMSYKSVL